MPPPRRFLIALFAAIAVAFTFPDVGDLTTHVIGDAGDAFFNLYVLRWVAHAAPDGWNALWHTSMFRPAPDTLAYSDPLLGLAPIHWFLERLLGGSGAAAFTVLHLAGTTAAQWFAYRLGLVLSQRHVPAVAAAVVYGFSAPRLTSFGHFQLAATAFVLPLAVLLVIRFLQTSSWRHALGLGAFVGWANVTSGYYGVLVAIAVAAMATVALAAGWVRDRRAGLVRLAAAAAVAAAIALPVGLRYLELGQDPHFQRDSEPHYSAQLDDYAKRSTATRLFPATGADLEDRLFPGFAAISLAAVGLVVVGRRSQSRTAALGVLAVASVCGFVLSFGDGFAGYRLAERIVPGLDGVRVTTRFAVLAHLGVAGLAAIGARRLGRIGAALAVVVVLAESWPRPQTTPVPRGEVVAVNQALDRRPQGLTVELPFGNPGNPGPYVYTEPARMVASTHDWHDRVNGYSGFLPKGYGELAAALASFPSEAAWDRIDELGVRYLVLRTASAGPDLGAGVTHYDARTAASIVRGLPPERVRRATRHGGGWLVELEARRVTSS